MVSRTISLKGLEKMVQCVSDWLPSISIRKLGFLQMGKNVIFIDLNTESLGMSKLYRITFYLTKYTIVIYLNINLQHNFQCCSFCFTMQCNELVMLLKTKQTFASIFMMPFFKTKNIKQMMPAFCSRG